MAQAQDDSAYNDNPYGVTDPTVLYQNLMDKAGPEGGAMSSMARSATAGGFNPAVQHSQAVQAQLQKIMAGVGDMQDGEDPIDHQMRQARAVATGMTQTDPNVAMKADQQMLRLQNAKTQQAHLQADTEHIGAETTASKDKEASDPMLWVKSGKDGMGLPTYQQIGQGTSLVDANGQYRPGWSQDALDELNKNGGFKPGTMQMRQSAYLSLLERTNEGRNIAAMARVQQQMQTQLMGAMPPNVIDDLATSIHDRDRPPQEMPTSRDPVSKMNYARLVEAYDAKYGPGAYASVDKSDFANNAKTYNEFGPGQSGARVQSFNVFLTHSNLLREYASRMKPDGSMPDVPFLNYFQTMWQKQGGQPAPQAFDAMRDIVADEGAQAIISSRNGAALTDREKFQEKLVRSSSQDQIGGVLDGWSTLGGGQLDGLERRYKSSLQGVPQDKVDDRWNRKLSPEAQAEYVKSHGGRVAPPNNVGGGAKGGGPAPTVKQTATYQSGPNKGRTVNVMTDGTAEFADGKPSN